MELKDPGRAWALLEKSFTNVTEPFKVSLAPAWTSMFTTPSPALTTLPPAGVDGECRWIRCCELPDRHGGLPAGSALWGHRVQVSAAAAEVDRLLPPALLTEPAFPSPRITAAGLTFDPTCPVGVSGVCISGISYQGSRLNFSLSAGIVTVEVTAREGRWAPSLEAELWPSRTRLPLPPGRPPQTPPRRPQCVPRPMMLLSRQDAESAFPAQQAGYKGQACTPHRSHALPQELPGRLSEDVEQLPQAHRPCYGTPLGPEAPCAPPQDPSPQTARAAPPATRVPLWVPPSGCTLPFSMPSWTPTRLHVAARTPLA